MAEELKIIHGDKVLEYHSIIRQIKALIEGERNLIANLASITAALKQQFQWFWVGFYLVKREALVLGPFQGPIACTRILKGEGVCGNAWLLMQSIIVPDVEKFTGHITCNSLSKSEIVVPVIRNGLVLAVLDVDSELYNHFDETDKKYLEEIVAAIQF